MKNLKLTRKLLAPAILIALLGACSKNELKELETLPVPYFTAPPVATVFSPLRTIGSSCTSGFGLCSVSLNNNDHYELTLCQPFKDEHGKWVMRLEINSQVPHMDDSLMVTENYALGLDISILLGYENIILKEGSYSLSDHAGVQTVFIHTIDPTDL